jgi:hypothetical protein
MSDPLLLHDRHSWREIHRLRIFAGHLPEYSTTASFDLLLRAEG